MTGACCAIFNLTKLSHGEYSSITCCYLRERLLPFVQVRCPPDVVQAADESRLGVLGAAVSRDCGG